jgi:hypothetical protein
MNEILLWLYLADSVLLINHEIDSAYWKEWDLFGLPGGIAGFLSLHFPLLLFILGGLVLISRGSRAGLVFSLVLALGGIFGFLIHTYFLKRGRKEFDTLMSKCLLAAMLVVSCLLLAATVYAMVL